MDYKKEYDEMVQRVKELHEAGNALTKKQMEIICPALAEIEDERIREELIGALMWQRDCLDAKGPHDNNLILPGFTMKVGDILARLEKQNEQKPDELDGKALLHVSNKSYDIGFRDGVASVKPAEWKPQPESLEALMYAIEGKWEMIKPTSYLSRKLEDLYEGLVNTFNVNETFLAELPKTTYTAKDIEELKKLKDKIGTSMDEKPAEWDELQAEFRNINEAFEDGKKEVIAHPERYGLCKPAQSGAMMMSG